MDYIEVSGKNVDEALTNALIQLETTSDKVEYEVIEKGSSGFLGMFNKPAVIRVRKKAEEVEETIETVKKINGCQELYGERMKRQSTEDF